MPRYEIKEKFGCWVTWTYAVEAASEEEAMALYQDGEAGDAIGEPEIGDNIDGYDQTSVAEVTTPAPEDRIEAEVHSDDYVVEVKFDAAPWFAQATDDEIVALHESGWGGDYAADDVARHFDDSATKPLFDYLGHNPRMGNDDPVGFECHVDRDQAIAYLKAHRPHIAWRLL